jgi:hypothetical protein
VANWYSAADHSSAGAVLALIAGVHGYRGPGLTRTAPRLVATPLPRSLMPFQRSGLRSRGMIALELL